METRFCAYCGQPFPATRPTRKYCTDLHARQDWQRRHRELYNARQRVRYWKGRTPYRFKVNAAVENPTRDDLMWAAGFLEGEGSFTRPSGSERIDCAQVDWWPITRLMRIFGGSVYPASKPYIDRARFQVLWIATGSRAGGVMMTLYPFLSPRRRAQIGASCLRSSANALFGKSRVLPGDPRLGLSTVSRSAATFHPL
jgi:hypothetical protein